MATRVFDQTPSYVPVGSLTTVTKVVECGMQYDGPAYNLQLLTLSCGHEIFFRGHAEIGKNIPCVTCLTGRV